MGRDVDKGEGIYYIRVSIHAPRVGRDAAGAIYQAGELVFQFTRPAWGATKFSKKRIRRRSFNSRAPRGARPFFGPQDEKFAEFQFTRPAWGATDMSTNGAFVPLFQFTRPAWGAT